MWTRLSLLAPMAGPYALSRTNPLHLKLQPAVHSAGCCLCGVPPLLPQGTGDGYYAGEETRDEKIS